MKLWQLLQLSQMDAAIAPPSGGAFRYLRFLIESAHGAGATGLEEIELRMTPGGATITTTTTVVTESSFAQIYQKGDSVVNQLTSGSNARWLATGNTNQWVVIDLGYEAAPVELAYLPAQDAITRAPKAFRIQKNSVSNLPTAPWVDIVVSTTGPRSLDWQVLSLL